MGIGDWAQSPIPNPQSPIPKRIKPIFKEYLLLAIYLIYYYIFNIFLYI
ncbi:MAG: hypothetical protein MJ252_26585 [archaeon]|nr:hypothetical protein [archaeon]